MADQENNEVIIIKKYANRRLYNTSTSSYITLENLYQMIKNEEEFVVKDAKSNEDLTRTILTQIIFEQEAKGYNLLPIPFLRQLISLYGSSNMEKLVPDYLMITMEQFLKNRQNFSSFSPNNWSAYDPMKAFESVAKQNMEMFDSAMKVFTNKDDDSK